MTHLPALALACAVMSAHAQVVENQPITATPAVYRFGIDTRWAYTYVPKAAQCNKLAFGNVDPNRVTSKWHVARKGTVQHSK